MDSRQKLHLITLKLQDSVAQTKLAEKSICLAWYSLSSFARKKEHLIYDLWSKVKTGSKTPRRLSKTKGKLNTKILRCSNVCCNRGDIQFPSRFSTYDITVNSFWDRCKLLCKLLATPRLYFYNIYVSILYTPLVSKLNTSVQNVSAAEIKYVVCNLVIRDKY